MLGEIIREALISPCGRYRYRLTRRWDDLPLLPFVMLNPSTADEYEDDPTIRRCMGFARREGLGGITVANMYGLRATNPGDLLRANDPFGPENDRALYELAFEAVVNRVPIVCAWGARGSRSNHHMRSFWQAGAKLKLVCLGKTKDGHPRHPLYVKADQPLEVFR